MIKINILIPRICRIRSGMAEFHAIMAEGYNVSRNFLKYFLPKMVTFRVDKKNRALIMWSVMLKVKKMKKKGPTEYTEGHRTFFVIISLYFFLCFSGYSVGSYSKGGIT